MLWLLALQLSLPATQHYENAQRDLAGMRFDQATQELNAALQLDPYFVPALTLKARLALFARRPDVARSCLITAVTVEPGAESAQFLLGVFYYLQNDFKLAIAPLETARTLSPGDPQPWYYLGLAREAMGDASTALASYQRAEDLSPQNTPEKAALLVAYGRLLLSLDRGQESLAKQRLAIEADPRSRDAHYELARTLYHQGDDAAAAEAGVQALALPGKMPSDRIHLLLGNIYTSLKKPDLAQAHLAQAHNATN